MQTPFFGQSGAHKYCESHRRGRIQDLRNMCCCVEVSGLAIKKGIMKRSRTSLRQQKMSLVKMKNSICKAETDEELYNFALSKLKYL